MHRTPRRTFAARLAALEALEALTAAEDAEHSPVAAVAALEPADVLSDAALLLKEGALTGGTGGAVYVTSPRDAYAQALAARVRELVAAGEKFLLVFPGDAQEAVAALEAGLLHCDGHIATRAHAIPPHGWHGADPRAQQLADILRRALYFAWGCWPADAYPETSAAMVDFLRAYLALYEGTPAL